MVKVNFRAMPSQDFIPTKIQQPDPTFIPAFPMPKEYSGPGEWFMHLELVNNTRYLIDMDYGTTLVVMVGAIAVYGCIEFLVLKRPWISALRTLLNIGLACTATEIILRLISTFKLLVNSGYWNGQL